MFRNKLVSDVNRMKQIGFDPPAKQILFVYVEGKKEEEEKKNSRIYNEVGTLTNLIKLGSAGFVLEF